MAEQQIIGNYRLLELLGGGTFGQVYRAAHRFLTTREVAIKIMQKAALVDEQEQKQFLAEATFLEKLQHPGILPILDAGIAEGVPYLVIEYAAGGSLRQRMRRYAPHAFPPIEALQILNQIAQALQYAHEQQIIHRDLKPENILFTARGDVLLADFGLATMLSSLSIEQAKISGTPLYMAPEQFKGQVCKESDQYALGCLAYELLTGQRPFQSSDIYALSYLHMYEIPTPPLQLNPSLPRPLANAIVTAMAKDRSARYPDIRMFRSFLVASREMWLEEGERLTRLHRPQEALDAWSQVIRLDPSNALAYNVKGQALHRLHRDQEALQLYNQALHLNPQLDMVYSNKAESLCALGRYQEALPICERAIQLNANLAMAHSHKGNILCALGHYEEALRSCERAAALNPQLVVVHATRADILRQIGRSQEALEACQRALRLDPRHRQAREIYKDLIASRSTERISSIEQ